MTKRLCSVEDPDGTRCPLEVKARGWCFAHYMRWKRNGDPGSVELRKVRGVKATCTADDCDEPHHARGLCDTHYERWRTKGGALSGVPVKRQRSKRRVSEHEMAIVSDWSRSAVEIAEEIGLHPITVAKYRRRMAHHEFRTSDWTEDEIDSIVGWIGLIDTPEMAKRLSRPVDQVKGEIALLRKHGFVPSRTNKSLDPWCVSGRPLLAKTCPDCGHFLGAEWFPKRAHSQRKGEYYWPNCKGCRADSKRNDPKLRLSSRSYETRMQAITLDQAENRGKEWTSKDLEVLEDPNKTVLQKALKLKRTYAGTAAALSRSGLTSKPEPIGDPESSAWKLFWEFEESDLAVAS